MKLTTLIKSSICCIFLAGCSSVPMKARHDLLGISRKELLSCAGVPDTRENTDTGQIFEYKQTQQVESPLNLKGPMSLELDLGGKGLCNAIFRIENDKVAQIEYTGPSATLLGKWAACQPLVKACEAYVKGEPK